ncbi:MAG: hypothetical protein LBG27_13865 [Spirochaetaceae bacterium]|jgi:hypothetical protein|nr:hypothetical protein [Spirochaetaceae bacterium]
MKCYQVSVRFLFHRHRPALVSTAIEKKRHVPAFFVRSGLPYGPCTRIRHYYRTRKDAEDYVAYLRKVYEGRLAADPAITGGQGWLFPDCE